MVLRYEGERKETDVAPKPSVSRGLLSYSPAGRVVLIEYTVQETFQTEAAVLAWASQYPEDQVLAHLKQVLHHVRVPSNRGLLRPLSGPRASVVLYRRVQAKPNNNSNLESTASGELTRQAPDLKAKRKARTEEDEPSLHHDQQLHSGGGVQESASSEPNGSSVSVSKASDSGGDSTTGHSRLQRSACISNVCYHTASGDSIRCGDDQCSLDLRDIGKQSSDVWARFLGRPLNKPAIISKQPAKKKQKVSGEGTRVSTLDRFNDIGEPVSILRECQQCGGDIRGTPSHYKYCNICFDERRSLL